MGPTSKEKDAALGFAGKDNALDLVGRDNVRDLAGKDKALDWQTLRNNISCKK